MAKKSTTRTTSSGSNYSAVKICAFWGVVLSGLVGLINFVLRLLELIGIIWTWGSKVAGACSFIAQLALFVSVWLAAWDFVRGKGKNWKIVYWIFLILSILGLVGIGIGSWL